MYSFRFLFYFILFSILPQSILKRRSVHISASLWTPWISAGRPAVRVRVRDTPSAPSTQCCSTCTTRWRSSTTSTPLPTRLCTPCLWRRDWQVGWPTHYYTIATLCLDCSDIFCLQFVPFFHTSWCIPLLSLYVITFVVILCCIKLIKKIITFTWANEMWQINYGT